MELTCEQCNGDKWKMVLHELRVMGQSIVYSAIKCDGCGMVYPLAELGKNQPKGSFAAVLKQ
ncbi:MAG: hypothetical protein BAJATHORv1_30506 [Candidatus Thorarchaeota archaeon]|nr:MAG: hypothetical protein BAJATHORv1_30506 [Candidatus Thorarchaeota archaeon]